jgi:hypothetical protein
MRGLRAKRVRMVKEGTLIATLDIGVVNNTGYFTTLDGRSTTGNPPGRVKPITP